MVEGDENTWGRIEGHSNILNRAAKDCKNTWNSTHLVVFLKSMETLKATLLAQRYITTLILLIGIYRLI